jgi:hypothetical protein
MNSPNVIITFLPFMKSSIHQIGRLIGDKNSSEAIKLSKLKHLNKTLTCH